MDRCFNFVHFPLPHYARELGNDKIFRFLHRTRHYIIDILSSNFCESHKLNLHEFHIVTWSNFSYFSFSPFQFSLPSWMTPRLTIDDDDIKKMIFLRHAMISPMVLHHPHVTNLNWMCVFSHHLNSQQPIMPDTNSFKLWTSNDLVFIPPHISPSCFCCRSLYLYFDYHTAHRK